MSMHKKLTQKMAELRTEAATHWNESEKFRDKGRNLYNEFHRVWGMRALAAEMIKFGPPLEPDVVEEMVTRALDSACL